MQEGLQCVPDLGHVYSRLHWALRLWGPTLTKRPVSPGVSPTGNTHPDPGSAPHTGHGRPEPAGWVLCKLEPTYMVHINKGKKVDSLDSHTQKHTNTNSLIFIYLEWKAKTSLVFLLYCCVSIGRKLPWTLSTQRSTTTQGWWERTATKPSYPVSEE